MIEIIEEVNALEPAMGPMAADPNDLIVRDGPLTQPFMDYVFDTGGIRRTWWKTGNMKIYKMLGDDVQTNSKDVSTDV